MDCPVCGLFLTESEYEGQKVMLCETCWGYFLEREKLDTIIDNRDYQFDQQEQKVVTKAFYKKDYKESTEIEGVRKCPECAKDMEKKPYSSKSPIKIDECIDHGIWLDSGEMKALQAFLEERKDKGVL